MPEFGLQVHEFQGKLGARVPRRPNVPQRRRCSYFYDVHTDVDDLKDKVEQLNCDLVLSAGKFADVLPKGINKGYSLQLLAKQYHFTIEKTQIISKIYQQFQMQIKNFQIF